MDRLFWVLLIVISLKLFSDLKYVVDTVARVRRELKGRVPLIGFAGSPWTVATYMVEGGSSKTFGIIKRMMYEAPRELHRLLELLARSTILYLNAQIAAGAQAVMVFDTWGGVLTPAQYEEFSLRYMGQVVDALTRNSEGRRVPNIVFTKGGGAWLDRIAAIDSRPDPPGPGPDRPTRCAAGWRRGWTRPWWPPRPRSR